MGSGKALWHNDYGYKCIPCQLAFDQGIYPKEILRAKASYYTDAELNQYFNLKGKILDGWIRAGMLRPVIIPCEKPNQIHFRLYLLSEHKDFLPPKSLLEVMQVKESRENGQDYFSFETNWYNLVNPAVHLKDYEIIKFIHF